MLNFKTISPKDTKWLQPVLDRTPNLCSDCSITCMVMWGNARIAECGGFYVPMVSNGNQFYYLRPLGGEDFAPILKELFEDSQARKIPFQMAGITQPVRNYLEQTHKFIYKIQQDYSDYIYTIDSLTTLRGRKLSAKRNHINHFELEHPDWSCEAITCQNLSECEAMTAKWFDEHNEKESSLGGIEKERRALSAAFAHYESFGFEGLALRIDGQIIAYSMGVPLNKTIFDVNFEKAFSSIPGAYAMINREFSRMIQKKYPEIQFLNREDDMGIAGLRQAKLSYHPAMILETYTALLPKTEL